MYVARSLTNRDSVLCQDGEVRGSMFTGPGGYPVKLWKTRAGAERAQRAWVEAGMREVVELTADGALPA